MADEFEARARELLATFRRDAGPSPAATERLLASLRRSAASEGLSGAAARPSEAPGGAQVLPLRRRGSSRHWIGVAVVGLAAAAVLIAMRVSPRRLDGDAGSAAAHHVTGDGSLESVRSRRSSAGGEAKPPAGAPEETVESPPSMMDGGASAAPITSEAGGSKAAPRRAEPPTRPAGSSAANSGAPQAAESLAGAGRSAPTEAAAALAQEVAQVRLVHDALAAGQPRQALALLEDHRRRFPAGALHEEAAALRAVALCGTDREGAGADAAAAFLAAQPGSLSAERVRQACGVR